VIENADLGQWLTAVFLGGTGFALNLTLISGIAGKTKQNVGMMAILGFPVILPFLVTLLKFSKNALDGLAWSVNLRYLLVLIAVDIIVAFLSYLLFPYLWRE
jgi:heme exporter protein B